MEFTITPIDGPGENSPIDGEDGKQESEITEQGLQSVLTDEQKEILEGIDGTQKEQTKGLVNDGTEEAGLLDLGDELVGEAVGESTYPDPQVNPVSIGDETISGTVKIGKNQRSKKKIDIKITVTVTYKEGSEPQTIETTILSTTKSQEWSVSLSQPLAAGDTIVVSQTVTEDGKSSPPSSLAPTTVKESLSHQHKDDLRMPSGTIYIKDPSSSLITAEEQAKVLAFVKQANPTFANDIESAELSIQDGTEAFITVTYTDNSKSATTLAPDLKIKKVTEPSAKPQVEEVKVTATSITINFASPVPEGTKIGFVKQIDSSEEKNFCENGSCSVVKSRKRELESTTKEETTSYTFSVQDDELVLEREFGILVEEPDKLVSCAKFAPQFVMPSITMVRDPHKITDQEKNAIRQAIRQANTTESGTCKLPDGTGDYAGTGALIDFDNNGNVRIINPSNVKGEWDWEHYEDGKFIPKQNDDGTYEVEEGSKFIALEAKDLVKNIKPNPPAISVNKDEGKVTITPPEYKGDGTDTDLLSYTISYTDANGTNQIVTATRNLDTNKWSGSGVDENTGVMTLSVGAIEVGGTVKAIAKDNGGLEGDTDKLDSDAATQTLETATVSYDGNGSSDAMEGKTLNKGSKYTILKNGFTAPENQQFKGWKIGETPYAADAEITVKEDTTIVAQWDDIEVKVSYDANGGSGSMDGATLKKGSTYKLLANGFTAPENQKFKGWKIGETEYAVDAEITVNENTTVQAQWEDIMVKITYDPNGGQWGTDGAKKVITVKKGTEITIETAPTKAGYTFQYWKGSEHQPGDSYTADADHTFTAQWSKTPEPNPNPDPNQPGPNPNDPNQPGPNPNDPNPDVPGSGGNTDQPGTGDKDKDPVPGDRPDDKDHEPGGGLTSFVPSNPEDKSGISSASGLTAQNVAGQTGQTLPVERIEALPATGSADASFSLFAGLGLALLGFFLKKRN